MRILYTATAYPPSTGGAQLHLHRLASELRIHHQIQVVSHWATNRTDWLLGTTLLAPLSSRDEHIDDVPVHRLGLSPGERLRMAPWLPIYYPLMRQAVRPIATILANHLEPFVAQADLIHNVRIGREGLSLASLLLARKMDRPFAFTPYHHPRWAGWQYQVYWDIYRAADLVFALTNHERETLIAGGVRAERIAVIGNGPILAPQADPSLFLSRYGIEGPIVLFLGQHYRYKGFRQVLEAAPLVWKRHPYAHFVFIGPQVRDSERYFKHTDRRIHRLGTVSLEMKSAALAACSLLCVPSNQESFGGIYTEAWSYAKPVIGGRIPAICEVISDGVDGFVVDQNPKQIADLINELLSNEKLARRMGLAGQAKVAEKFAWTKIAQAVERAYECALRGRPQRLRV